MDLQLVKRGFDFSTRKRKFLLFITLFGCSSYGVYKVYHLPSVVRKRRRFVNLIGALISIVEMFSDSAETISIVSKDLNEFLHSDSDKIPNSLKQLSKIIRSEEYSQSLVRVSQAVTVGILQGYSYSDKKDEIIEEEGNKNSNLSDKLIDKLVSPAGTGFVSVVVGSFARNLVMGFFSNEQSENGSNSNSSNVPMWIDLLCNEKSKSIIADSIQTFVGTAVSIYLDKTMDINVYDDIFSGLTNPKHHTQVRDMMVSICNGVVETLVKTSHQVLTNSKSTTEVEESYERNLPIDIKNSGWVSSVSSTLSVPRNRRFVFDLTGRVTFETVKSIVNFLFWKMKEGLKRSVEVAREDVLERGLEVIRYIGARSYVILTICLALFLHILGGSKVLLPA